MILPTILGSKMDDYAKARYKTSRKLTIIKMIAESGGMNPEMSAVDFVMDGDLNKSLEHFVRFLNTKIEFISAFLMFCICHYSVWKFWKTMKTPFSSGS